ncbi:TetR family transcriptional regulator [Glycomyces scopariae]
MNSERGPRRPDPGRRDRIIDACLDVVAESGVAGASHRKVAAAAGVPLGSMTYHFNGIGELLHEAFARFGSAESAAFDAAMAAAAGPAEAEAVIVGIVTAPADPRNLVLAHELYTLAAREPAFRDLTNEWMARSRASLERHFDPEAARMVDALIEGLTIHASLDTEPQDPAVAAEAVRRILRR